MPPLPRDNRDKRDRRANTQKLIFDYSFVNSTHFSVKDVHFLIKLPMWPKGFPKRAKGSRPKGSKGTQRTPRGSPRAPQRVKTEAKVGPGGAKGVPKTPKGGQRKPKGKIYIKKLPINRPSGRYVIRVQKSQGHRFPEKKRCLRQAHRPRRVGARTP